MRSSLQLGASRNHTTRLASSGWLCFALTETTLNTFRHFSSLPSAQPTRQSLQRLARTHDLMTLAVSRRLQNDFSPRRQELRPPTKVLAHCQNSIGTSNLSCCCSLWPSNKIRPQQRSHPITHELKCLKQVVTLHAIARSFSSQLIPLRRHCRLSFSAHLVTSSWLHCKSQRQS